MYAKAFQPLFQLPLTRLSSRIHIHDDHSDDQAKACKGQALVGERQCIQCPQVWLYATGGTDRPASPVALKKHQPVQACTKQTFVGACKAHAGPHKQLDDEKAAVSKG